MPEVDWQTVLYPAFPVLWCSISHDDRPAPLQIRPFTSDSHRIIKERERKKKRRQINTKSEQWSEAQNKDVLSESASLDTVLPPADSGRSDGISVLDSGDLQRPLPVLQDDCRTQLNDDFQPKLASLSAASMSLLEGQSEGEFQCLPLATSAFSPNPLDLAYSEITTGTELGCETLREAGLDPSITSTVELRGIPSDDDTATSIQQPDRYISDPCEQQSQSGDAAVSLELMSEHKLAVATTPPSRHFADESGLAEATPDRPIHVVGMDQDI